MLLYIFVYIIRTDWRSLSLQVTTLAKEIRNYQNKNNRHLLILDKINKFQNLSDSVLCLKKKRKEICTQIYFLNVANEN